jgi:HEAT repeat protein
MGFVDGFEPQILEALKSDDPELKLEAVRAAGNQGVEKAWPHIRALLRSRRTNRNLLLVAIEAAGSMDDEEAMEILYELNESDDEEIAEAAEDALTFAGLDDDEEGEEDEFGDDDEGEDEEEED